MQSALVSPFLLSDIIKRYFWPCFSQEISRADFFPWLCYVLFKHFMQKQRSGGIHVAAKVLLHVSAALKKHSPLVSSSVERKREGQLSAVHPHALSTE